MLGGSREGRGVCLSVCAGAGVTWSAVRRAQLWILGGALRGEEAFGQGLFEGLFAAAGRFTCVMVTVYCS